MKYELWTKEQIQGFLDVAHEDARHSLKTVLGASNDVYNMRMLKKDVEIKKLLKELEIRNEMADD